MSTIKRFLFNDGGASLLLRKIIESFPHYYKKKYGKTYQKPNKGYIEEIQKELYKGDLISNGALIRNFIMNNVSGGGEKEIAWKPIKGLFEKGAFFINDKDADSSQYGSIVDRERKTVTGTRSLLTDDIQATDWTKQVESLELRSSEIDSLTQKCWMLYRFWEGEDSISNLKQKSAGIRASRIYFKLDPASSKSLLVRVASLDKPSELNIHYYEGKCYPRQVNGHLYIETGHLMVAGKNDRYLRMIFYFGPNDIDELATGVYYNVRRHGALLSGSALLLRLEEYPINVESIIYQRWSDLSDDVIKNFFQRKDLNMIRLPNILPYTLDILENVIDEYLNEEIEIRFYEFDFFVSIPLTFNKMYGGDYNRNMEIANRAITSFQNRFFYNTYFLANEGKNAEEASVASNPSRLATLQTLDRCRCLLFILPYLSHNAISTLKNESIIPIFTSSAITELGYALGMKKPVYILCDNRMKEHVPSNVKAISHRVQYAYYTESNIDESIDDAVNSWHMRYR
ncbi:hypothetical protein ACAW74_22880 [Fibrella sp. WM1]|uniref:hypothetical protein n=1 Tax=Fibrella musci TaxID=3242485 RepID=UPI003521549D